eukprot:TRINITY_DN5924_c0_g1_i6.p1 TRINITY_DN5924_c0_g1~~TRINITY_DN5924_c0_g1_i6.p1  ORF type:complete len:507 (+),score=126.15 TRINITY_DN5924_c0_g1_i6:96-1523(+)
MSSPRKRAIVLGDQDLRFAVHDMSFRSSFMLNDHPKTRCSVGGFVRVRHPHKNISGYNFVYKILAIGEDSTERPSSTDRYFILGQFYRDARDTCVPPYTDKRDTELLCTGSVEEINIHMIKSSIDVQEISPSCDVPSGEGRFQRYFYDETTNKTSTTMPGDAFDPERALISSIKSTFAGRVIEPPTYGHTLLSKHHGTSTGPTPARPRTGTPTREDKDTVEDEDEKKDEADEAHEGTPKKSKKRGRPNKETKRTGTPTREDKDTVEDEDEKKDEADEAHEGTPKKSKKRGRPNKETKRNTPKRNTRPAMGTPPSSSSPSPSPSITSSSDSSSQSNEPATSASSSSSALVTLAPKTKNRLPRTPLTQKAAATNGTSSESTPSSSSSSTSSSSTSSSSTSIPSSSSPSSTSSLSSAFIPDSRCLDQHKAWMTWLDSEPPTPDLPPHMAAFFGALLYRRGGERISAAAQMSSASYVPR